MENLEYKYADTIFNYILKHVNVESLDDLPTNEEKEFIRDTSECLQVLLKSYIGRKNKTDDQVAEHNKLLKRYLAVMVRKLINYFFSDHFKYQQISVFCRIRQQILLR